MTTLKQRNSADQNKAMVEVFEVRMPESVAAKNSITAEKIIKRLECVD